MAADVARGKGGAIGIAYLRIETSASRPEQHESNKTRFDLPPKFSVLQALNNELENIENQRRLL